MAMLFSARFAHALVGDCWFKAVTAKPEFPGLLASPQGVLTAMCLVFGALITVAFIVLPRLVGGVGLSLRRVLFSPVVMGGGFRLLGHRWVRLNFGGFLADSVQVDLKLENLSSVGLAGIDLRPGPTKTTSSGFPRRHRRIPQSGGRGPPGDWHITPSQWLVRPTRRRGGRSEAGLCRPRTLRIPGASRRRRRTTGRSGPGTPHQSWR